MKIWPILTKVLDPSDFNFHLRVISIIYHDLTQKLSLLLLGIKTKKPFSPITVLALARKYMLTRKAQKCWREHISRPEYKGFSLKKTKTGKSMNCSAPSTFLTDKVTWPFNDDQWRICPRTANYRAHMFRFDKSFLKIENLLYIKLSRSKKLISFTR